MNNLNMGTTMSNMGISFVDASNIKSQWQANFLQIFPVNYSALPTEHESDKKCFEQEWRGDSHTTFEEFKKNT